MIKVFRLKDLIKYIITIVVPLTLIFISISFITKKISNKNNNEARGKVITTAIDESTPLLRAAKIDDDDKLLKEWGKVILDSEFTILNNNEEVKEEFSETIQDEENNKKEIEESEIKENEIKQAEENVKTEVVQNNVNPKYNKEYNGVKINNSTDYELNDNILNPQGLEINKENIIIYHTHTCESYTPTELFNYEASGNFRTTNLEYSVARVGDELASQLISYNWNVLHDKTFHDFPAYNGSYSRSLNTIRKLTDENKNADIVIDLHRDAIADSSYAPKVKIGEEFASQLMFVIGTNVAVPEHTNWNQNLKFAIKVQEKANELYPGLFKPIILRNSAYNQYVSKAACIIEVGATGNTLEESICSMKYLAKVLQEL